MKSEHAKTVQPLVADAKALSAMGFGSVRHIQRLDSAGKLPHALCLGRRKVWVVDEVREWLTAGAPPRAEWEQIKAMNGDGTPKP